MLCVDRDGSLSHRAKPRNCGIYVGPWSRIDTVSYNVLHLDSLRWRQWGRATATGRGVYFKMNVERVFTVTIFRRVRCVNGSYAYTRVRLSSRRGKSTYRMLLPEFC